jgi:hypothetical protein
MDGHRFDAWARRVAAHPSRRGLLRGLLGGAAAGALSLAGVRGAGAVACRTPGELCRGNADCCARLCAADAAGRHTCRCRTAADCLPPTNKCLAATCAAGVCGTAVGVVCAALDQCHLAGLCLPATGTCTNPAQPNGTTCDDGDACTQTDTCQNGVCVGSNPVVCTASDQCHTAGACDPTSGQCSNPLAQDGTACDDGNACTTNDVCTNGVCAGTAVTNGTACGSGQSCCGGYCCPSTTGTQCYWLDCTHFGSNCCWVPTSSIHLNVPDQASCQGLDCCSAGGGCELIGCYKWANSSC